MSEAHHDVSTNPLNAVVQQFPVKNANSLLTEVQMLLTFVSSSSSC